MNPKTRTLFQRRQVWEIQTLEDPSLELVALDLETTGFSPRISRVIEVAAVRFNLNGETLDSYSSVALPDGEYVHAAEEIHGITEEEVLNAPPLGDVLNDLLEFIGNSPVVVHNLKFEDQFLTAELLHYNVPLPRIDGICTLQAAKHVFPGLRKYSLDELVKHLQLVRVNPSHRALPDTHACVELFCNTVKVWRADGCLVSEIKYEEPTLPGFETALIGVEIKTARHRTRNTVPSPSGKSSTFHRPSHPSKMVAAPTAIDFPMASASKMTSGSHEQPLFPQIEASTKFGFRPTSEQTNILDAFHQGGDLKITAGAGTGKTSILRLIAESSKSNGTYVAFNRAIAMEARKSFPSNISSSTAHSLAVRMLRADGKGAVIDKLSRPRIPLRHVAGFLGLKGLRLSEVRGQAIHFDELDLARATLDMVRNFCQSADVSIDLRHAEPIPQVDAAGGNKNNKVIADYILPFAKMAWRDITGPSGTGIEFEHHHYLKLWALSSPKIGREGDMLLIDESQDLNPALVSVVSSQNHLQKIYVGDANQAIYGFTGAIDALSTFEAAHSLSLTQSWRFGDPIAHLANGWLQDLGSTLQLSGNPSRISKLTGDEGSDAVLCRMNATAVAEVMRAYEQHQSVSLTGGGDDALWFVRDVQKFKDGHRPTHRNLSAFSKWTDVIEYIQHAGQSAHEMKTWVSLINSFGEQSLEHALTTLKPEKSARVTVSTAHKAKGREWDTVRIASDFAIKRHAEVPTEIDSAKSVRAEQMLAYVAVTRARIKINPGVLSDGPLPDQKTGSAPITVTLTPDQQEAFTARLGIDFETWLSQQT